MRKTKYKRSLETRKRMSESGKKAWASRKIIEKLDDVNLRLKARLVETHDKKQELVRIPYNRNFTVEKSPIELGYRIHKLWEKYIKELNEIYKEFGVTINE